MKKWLFHIILSVALLSSCIREIDIKYPETGGMLTLNCIMSPGNAIQANVSSTLPYQQKGASPFYKDAQVTLYVDGKFADTLVVDSGTYRENVGDTIWTYSSGYPVEVGKTYELRVFKMGFPEISGSTTIPSQAQVKNITHTVNGAELTPYYITINDPEKSDNYFILKMNSQDNFSSYPATLYSDDPTIELYSYFGIVKSPLEQSSGNSAFFTDQYFKNGQKVITLTASSETTTDDGINQVQLLTVSKEYYDYVKSLAINDAVSENPFSEPIRIKSNIKNGLGLVGAINSYELNF